MQYTQHHVATSRRRSKELAMFVIVVLLTCNLLNQVNGAKKQGKANAKKVEVNKEAKESQDVVEDLLGLVEDRKLALETAQSVRDKLGESILKHLKDSCTDDESYMPVVSKEVREALRQQYSGTPRQETRQETRRASYPTLVDVDVESTKANTLRLMQHIVYAAQDAMMLLAPLVRKYSPFIRFRLAYTFRTLEQIGHEMRVLYLRLHNLNSKFGYPTTKISLYYYSFAFKKYFDIIYISDQIALVFHRYKWDKVMKREEYIKKIALETMNTTLPTLPPLIGGINPNGPNHPGYNFG